MWNVTFDSLPGGQPSVFWVAAQSADEAEFVARQQIRRTAQGQAQASATVRCAEDIDPVDDAWPRPCLIEGIRVHTFADSATAYHHAQHRPDIHDGDVVYIPSEDIAGFLMQSRPVAISSNHGRLDTLPGRGHLVVGGVDYTCSARIAEMLVLGADAATQSVPPPTVMLTRGLVSAPGVWTVTIAGAERHDGHGPYIWVVNAPDAAIAVGKAEQHHRTTEQDTDTVVRRVEPGAPGAEYGWAYNDLRGITAQTIVLTPRHVRQIARLRLAHKRRDARYIRVSKTLMAGERLPLAEANALDELTAGIVDLLGDVMDALGYPL
jgi:hypothetical protein